MTAYVSRRLRQEATNEREATIVSEADLYLGQATVVIGDQGLGKTRLTESLALRPGAHRVKAGTLVRHPDPAKLFPPGTNLLVIDGLDEVTAGSGGGQVDAVLSKLMALGTPPFVLSCRAADWKSSVDRTKIAEDYGVEPVTYTLLPFDRGDAEEFLSSFFEGGDHIPGDVLDELEKRGLAEFYSNPLTLTFVAGGIARGEPLPSTKSGLLTNACRDLLVDINPNHEQSETALTPAETLLDSAGALSALILLSGSIGFSQRPLPQTPGGYTPFVNTAGMPSAPAMKQVLGTRIFRSDGEGLFAPFHRVLAEFLAARWLAKLIENGLSPRRLQALIVEDQGVPTPLRGLHAWLAQFSPLLAEECVRRDPYGILLYGDVVEMTAAQVRTLIASLARLADEDPYFRSDWSPQSGRGLARAELADDIAETLVQTDHRFPLRALLLHALAGTEVAHQLALTLLAIIQSPQKTFHERASAAEAFDPSAAATTWPEVVEGLLQASDTASHRLAVEIISDAKGAGFEPNQIARAYLIHEKLLSTGQSVSADEADDDDTVTGVGIVLSHSLNPEISAKTLDQIVTLLPTSVRHADIEHRFEAESTFRKLIDQALETERDPARIWRWLSAFGDKFSRSRDSEIEELFRKDAEIRRSVQREALYDTGMDVNDVVYGTLFRLSMGLHICAEDSLFFLGELDQKERWTARDVELWQTLARSAGSHLKGRAYARLIERASAKDVQIAQFWEGWSNPVEPPWQREERIRRNRYEQSRRRRFRVHRADFKKRQSEIESGADLGAIIALAQAYLGKYNLRAREPVARLEEWVGPELTESALKGLRAALHRSELPNLDALAEAHAASRWFKSELVYKAATEQMTREGIPLSSLSQPVLEAAMAAWWHLPTNSKDEDANATIEALEAEIFGDPERGIEMARRYLEPAIKANRDYVFGLYHLKDERLGALGGDLALRWLSAEPSLHQAVQEALMEIAAPRVARAELVAAIRARLSGDAENLLWTAAALVFDYSDVEDRFSQLVSVHPELLWEVQRFSGVAAGELTVPQLAAFIQEFGSAWPKAEHPRGGWSGQHNAWDASQQIRVWISSLAGHPTPEATAALDELVRSPDLESYRDHLKHSLAEHSRTKRDHHYASPNPLAVISALSGGTPRTLDDLRARTVDALYELQDYLRNGDTRGWRQFWENGKHLDENTSRDRVLDQLRLRLRPLNLTPESLMPALKRSDILVHLNSGEALPVEVKGQWHSEVWDAAQFQLYDRYGRDWRADDRGIYLVLWLGPDVYLSAHPDGVGKPKSPVEFRELLEQRLPSQQRQFIEIVVLDVSPE